MLENPMLKQKPESHTNQKIDTREDLHIDNTQYDTRFYPRLIRDFLGHSSEIFEKYLDHTYTIEELKREPLKGFQKEYSNDLKRVEQRKQEISTQLNEAMKYYGIEKNLHDIPTRLSLEDMNTIDSFNLLCQTLKKSPEDPDEEAYITLLKERYIPLYHSGLKKVGKAGSISKEQQEVDIRCLIKDLSEYDELRLLKQYFTTTLHLLPEIIAEQDIMKVDQQ